ncbi:sensor histidine kinase [Actinocorallia longicatena]|uniref:histidine kinase n=1 Tax=Actinocorallia longicatena TaxID=111803 RepID=A0ABP6QII3_9ACTN
MIGRWRPEVKDAGLAGLAAVLAVVDAVAGGNTGVLRLGGTAHIVIGVAGAGILVFRRRRPYAVSVISSLVNFMIYAPAQGLLGLFSAGRYGDSLARLVMVAIFGFGTAVPGAWPVDMIARGISYTALFVTAAVAIGRQSRRYVLGVEQSQRMLREEYGRTVERARLEERARIAGELHDSVAHRVTLMTVQAGALEAAGERSAELVSVIAGQIRAAGRAAMEELRQVLGVLRLEADVVGTAPKPDLDEVVFAVGEARRIGIEVALQISGTARPLPPAVAQTAVRIVREALENVAAHAGRVPAEVRVDFAADRLLLEVENGPAPQRTAREAPGGSLLNLGQRLNLLGGEFTAGPTHRGGFLVQAVLPLAGEEEGPQ